MGICSVGAVDPERAQVAERLALDAVAARRRSTCASARSWWASALVILSRSAASARVGEPLLGLVQLALELEQLRPRGLDRRQRVALVAVDDLRQVAR